MVVILPPLLRMVTSPAPTPSSMPSAKTLSTPTSTATWWTAHMEPTRWVGVVWSSGAGVQHSGRLWARLVQVGITPDVVCGAAVRTTSSLWTHWWWWWWWW